MGSGLVAKAHSVITTWVDNIKHAKGFVAELTC